MSEQKNKVYYDESVKIDLIKPNPNQPRKEHLKPDIESLADSIKNCGLLQPISIRKSKGEYVLVAGESRIEAFKFLGKKTIPAIVHPETMTTPQAAILSIVENYQRKDMSTLDTFNSIASLLSFQLSESNISSKLGKSISFVNRIKKIVNSGHKTISFIDSGSLNSDVALQIYGLQIPEESIIEMIEKASSGRWSMNSLREYISKTSFAISGFPWVLSEGENPCTECLHRSDRQSDMFPESNSSNAVCMSKECHKKKLVSYANKLIAECSPYRAYCDVIKDDSKPFLVTCLSEAPIRFRSLGVITWGDLARSLSIDVIINITDKWEKVMCVSSLEITRKMEELNPSKRVKVKEHERKISGETISLSDPLVIPESCEPIEVRFLDRAWEIAEKLGIETIECDNIDEVVELIISSLK